MAADSFADGTGILVWRYKWRLPLTTGHAPSNSGHMLSIESFLLWDSRPLTGCYHFSMGKNHLDAEEAAVGIDEGDGFDGVVVAPAPAMDTEAA